VAFADGHARRKAIVQVPDAPPTSSKCWNLSGCTAWIIWAAAGCGDIVHGADERLAITVFTTHTGRCSALRRF